jgi:SAM-dependent methyltransferase
MKVPAEAPALRLAELVERDGIFHRSRSEWSAYKHQWEAEALDDHVASAIARGSAGAEDYETLTGKISPLWDRFPQGLHVGTVLEIGSGYGRIPLHLGREHDLTWESYCAVDISETMLRRLLEYRARFDLVPDGRLYPVCASADELPLEDDSVDLVLTSAVFLHMGKSFVGRTVAEIARVLKPGGSFVFDVSFPNARNPSSYLPRLKPKPLRSPNFLKYWTRAEVQRLLRSSGLDAKAGPTVTEPTSFALLPKRIGPVGLPLSRRINAALGDPERFRDVLAVSYSAYSEALLR